MDYIAEIGLNHNGDLNLAKEMVQAAKESGANSVKFQSLNKDRLLAQSDHANELNLGFADVNTVGGFLEKVGLGSDFHYQIKGYCDKLGVEFLSTPFDFHGVELLDELGVKRFKIASGDLTYTPLIEKVLEKGKPILLSVGMASDEEIEKVVDVINEKHTSTLTLLHCTSLYPTPPDLANLNALEVLYEQFKKPVGFSDHTKGFHLPIAAIAKGAKVIEKHFTTDNNLPGPDQKISADPKTFAKMVQYGDEVASALESKSRQISDDEKEMRKAARRSVVAARDLEKGAMIHLNDLDYKRPGDGLSPIDYTQILGKKLINSKGKDEQITLKDIDGGQ